MGNKFTIGLLTTFVLLAMLQHGARAENILFFMGVTTYSHRIGVWPLVERLADMGHNVTFFSAHPPKGLANPKVHEFTSKALQKALQSFVDTNLLEMRKNFGHGAMARTWFDLITINMDANELIASDEEFQQWFRSASFDLVVVDALTCEFAVAMAHKFKAPFMIASTTAPYNMWQHDLMGGPLESSWLPDMQWVFPEEMGLWHRILNTLNSGLWDILRNWYFYPKIESIFREKLGVADLPPIVELQKNMSLILANSHFSDDYARSYPPVVVSVSGMHCYQEVKPAPKEMEKFMNESGGFIYINFGSAVLLSQMPQELRNIFFTAMGKAKTKFLIKWNEDIPSDMPKNVYATSWIPQRAVLAHPNIKAFITHGGFLGTQEAIYAGVPLIFCPIFGEQDYNAQKIQGRGGGIRLELATLTQDVLDDAISKMLTDSSYKRNMEVASKLFKDRPENPIDTAIWWVQYILRHGNVPEMKPRGIHQSWYRRRLIDVWFTLCTLLILTSAIFLFGVFKIVTKVFSKSSPNNNKSTSSKRKKKQN